MFWKLSALLARPVALGLVSAVLAVPALAQNSNAIEFKQVWSTTGAGEIGVKPEIVVSGSNGQSYDRIETGTIDMWFSLKFLEVPGLKSAHIPDIAEIIGEGKTIPATGAGYSPKIYKFSFPYADPHSPSVVGQRNSPIKTCNDRLANLPSGQRFAFLRDGARIEIERAYPFLGRGVAIYTVKDGIFDEVRRKNHDDNIDARAIIVCQPLGAPERVTGAPLRTPSAPFVSAATLRIEPAQVVTVDKQLCPSQLRLYGHVQANRAFDGKAVIFGTGYLSPVTELNFPKGGNRNFTAIYPLSWNKSGGLSGGPATANRSQTVNLTMNVTSKTNSIIEQVKETVTVTCKSIAVTNPIAIGDVTAAKPQTGDPDQPAIGARLAIGPNAGEPRPARIVRENPASFFVSRAENGCPASRHRYGNPAGRSKGRGRGNPAVHSQWW